MEKRYQVFVSSTYKDLLEERQEVMQALLELDCIPAGMELFPAANDDQWSLIKKVIDDCDYYLVILAGRYGSQGADGFSYTEMEYRYALSVGKPVLGFLHKDPATLPQNRCEAEPAARANLEAFRELLQKRMCRFWESSADLGSQVSRSLVKLIKTTPAVGWVRGDAVAGGDAAEEILQLTKRVSQLEQELSAALSSAPAGTEELAQGDDEHVLNIHFDVRNAMFDRTRYDHCVSVTWNTIFARVAPRMINEASEAQLAAELDSLARDQALPDLRTQKNLRDVVLEGFTVKDQDFHTVKVQLRALGLIAKSSRTRSVKDTATYWSLTPYGDAVMTRLRAIRRPTA